MVYLPCFDERIPKLNIHRKVSVAVNEERFSVAAIYGRGPYYVISNERMDMMESEVIFQLAVWGCQFTSFRASFDCIVVSEPVVWKNLNTFDRQAM